VNRGPAGIAAVVVLSAALFAAVDTASAQYMYLDTNGDGIHTDADVIAPTGTTTVDVWIHTDANRDGSPVTCASAGDSLDIMSYEFILHANDGTIAWGAFANNPPNSLPLGQVSDSVEFVSGYCFIVKSAPGLHRLATLSLQIGSGTPSLSIVADTPLSTIHFTSFGSACDSPDGDNTFFLGSEWCDTDGARYGGWINPPVLAQPTNMTVAESATADQSLSVTDPDGPTLTLAKTSGPPYMTVLQDGSGPSSTWRIHLAPGFSDSGTAIGQVEASDGAGKDFRSFRIRVLNTNRAPYFEPISALCVEEGATAYFRIQALDPDNDPLTLTEENRPSYASSESYAGSLVLRVSPPPGQAPDSATIQVTASDGALSVAQQLELRVTELGGCSGRSPLVARAAPNPMRHDGYLMFWTSKPGPLRVTLYDLRGRAVRTLLDDRNASAANHQIPIQLGSQYDPSRLVSGVYFWRIEGVDGVRTGRLVVLRGTRHYSISPFR
jgi:hypothetical protein